MNCRTLAAVFCLITSFELNAQKIEFIISDKSSGEPIEGAVLKLNGEKSKYSAFSNKGGFAEIIIKEIGVYELSVKHIGYRDFSLKDINFTGSDTVISLFLTSGEIITEKINVTATRTELTLKQTPSSLSIITSDDISARNPLTFDEALSGVQGITLFRSSGINVQSLSIRGSSDVAGGGIGNRVLLLVDGRPSLAGDSRGALWSLVPLLMIDRTEVVKGAFSSLYGSNAIGGVINIITRKPEYKPRTTINLSGGFYEKLNDSLRWSDKLLTYNKAELLHSNTYKKLAYLVNLNYNCNSGHAEQTAYVFFSAIGKFMYDVLMNRDLEVTFQYTDSKSDYPHYWRKDPGKIAEPFKTNPVYIGDKITKKTWSADIYYRAVPGSRLKYDSRFYFYRLSSVSFYNPNNFVAQNYGTPGRGFETFIKSYNFGNITQFDNNLSDDNYLTAGLDLQYNIVHSRPESILYGNQQAGSYALFLQNKHIFIRNGNNPLFSGIFGIRADYSDYKAYKKYFQISPKLSFLIVPSSDNFILKNTSVRILLGKAFRTPSIAEIYFKKELFGGFDFVFNPALKPEQMYSAEIGLRKEIIRRLSADICAFINYYSDMIQYVNIGGRIDGPFQVQNIASAQITGMEAAIDLYSDLKLFNNLLKYRFNLNYTYCEARDKSPSRTDDFLPYKPKHLINFSADLVYRNFTLNLNGKYQSKIEEVIFFRYEEPQEYLVMNLKLGWQYNDLLKFFINVNNLTDSRYQELERIQAPNRSISFGVNTSF
jgi:iron complex outermembrane receptor protein